MLTTLVGMLGDSAEVEEAATSVCFVLGETIGG